MGQLGYDKYGDTSNTQTSAPDLHVFAHDITPILDNHPQTGTHYWLLHNHPQTRTYYLFFNLLVNKTSKVIIHLTYLLINYHNIHNRHATRTRYYRLGSRPVDFSNESGRLKHRRQFRKQVMGIQDGSMNEDGRFPPGGAGGAGAKEMKDVKSAAAGAVGAAAVSNDKDRYESPRAALYKKASISRKGVSNSDDASTLTSTIVNEDATANNNNINNINNINNNALSRSNTLSRTNPQQFSNDNSPATIITTRSTAIGPSTVVRFSDDDVENQSDDPSTLADTRRKARPPPPPNVIINYKAKASTTDYEMTAYSPEPVGYDNEADEDGSDYSVPPVANSPSPLDAYQSGWFMNAIQDYHAYGSPEQPQPVVYRTDAQLRRQSPPPPPKSLKRLSPVLTTGSGSSSGSSTNGSKRLSKNYQQAVPIASTAPTAGNIKRTSSVSAVSSRIERTGFEPRITPAQTGRLSRSSSTSSSSSGSSLHRASSVSSSISSTSRGTSLLHSDSPMVGLNSKFANTYYNMHYGRGGSIAPVERKVSNLAPSSGNPGAPRIKSREIGDRCWSRPPVGSDVRMAILLVQEYTRVRGDGRPGTLARGRTGTSVERVLLIAALLVRLPGQVDDLPGAEPLVAGLEPWTRKLGRVAPDQPAGDFVADLDLPILGPIDICPGLGDSKRQPGWGGGGGIGSGLVGRRPVGQQSLDVDPIVNFKVEKETLGRSQGRTGTGLNRHTPRSRISCCRLERSIYSLGHSASIMKAPSASMMSPAQRSILRDVANVEADVRTGIYC
ncbi:hypothetical protein BGX29_004383 [Mortierella sp. GBA35]|nr:hypothetical protein BGX29_004383 [Mortierella sp. GBA35]